MGSDECRRPHPLLTPPFDQEDPDTNRPSGRLVGFLLYKLFLIVQFCFNPIFG